MPHHRVLNECCYAKSSMKSQLSTPWKANADRALSRAFLHTVDECKSEIAEDIDVLVHTLLHDFPASYNRLSECRHETQTNPVLFHLQCFIQNGFPTDKSTIPADLNQFEQLKSQMVCCLSRLS